MKLFIWEGNGISDAYHDDGCLVVLAETAEQAREVVRQEKADKADEDERLRPQRNEIYQDFNRKAREGSLFGRWHTPEGAALVTERDRRIAALLSRPYWSEWDGTDEALNREPDRVVDLDKPCVVAFNGGGYD